jgi:hypothetical protein
MRFSEAVKLMDHHGNKGPIVNFLQSAMSKGLIVRDEDYEEDYEDAQNIIDGLSESIRERDDAIKALREELGVSRAKIFELEERLAVSLKLGVIE